MVKNQPRAAVHTDNIVIRRCESAGFKFGRWLDAVFMQRALGESDSTLPEG